MSVTARIVLVFALAWGAGCAGSPAEPEASGQFSVPANLAASIPSPERNPLTAEGVELGRTLFHDPILSGNNLVACATCHEQAKGFSDGEVISSAGVSGNLLLRHTPALINLAWMDGYFWDGGGYDLESQAFGPLQHVDEMGQDVGDLVDEIKEHPRYPALFAAAFDDGITIPNIVRALAQFQRSLVSAHSRYDQFVRGEAGGALTDAEKQGLTLVREKCGGCHATDFFTDFSYRNTGLDDEYPDDDLELAWGRARITLDAEDMGKYKVPTLRNVMLTAPYMHDGRFATLDDVFDHYRFGVRETPTLDSGLRRAGGELGIALTDQQVGLMKLFLETLTDHWFVTNEAFSKPVRADEHE